MGDMRLSGNVKHRTGSVSPVRRTSRQQTSFCNDTHVRLEQKTHRTGPLHLFLRAHMFDKETECSHADDLVKILQPIVNVEKRTAEVQSKNHIKYCIRS